MNGTWCCEETTVVQVGNAIYTNASYGTGQGTIQGNYLSVLFSNNPSAAINGTVDASCTTVQWSNGAMWTRSFWPGPATNPPAWTDQLMIYELNPKGYTSPNGTGDGSGSGTWQSLTEKLPYLADLGVTGLWIAGSVDAEVHFYNIWTVYATRDPTILDKTLGTDQDFATFVQTAHSYDIKVFLDVVTHGICNDSPYITQYPSWFTGGSWGMTDYNYTNTDFFNWWNTTWNSYVKNYQIDGYRLDIADTDWELHGFDGAALTGQAMGHEIAVFGETRRYHFMQHDISFSPFTFTDMTALFANTPCYYTTQISCHDFGWESSPGNYYAIQGSRAWFGYAGIFAYNIPVWFGGEEFNAVPVSLPNLQKELYGGGGPGGWMYGTQLQWDQLQNANQSAMFTDTKRMIAITKQESDILHRNRCNTSIVRISVNNTSPADILAVPYARYIAGTKAVCIFANMDTIHNATLTVTFPLAGMGFATNPATLFWLTDLWGSNGNGTVSVTYTQLQNYSIHVPMDHVPGGGLAVFRIVPQ